MERCIHKYLYNYIVSNQILTPLQSGFVPGDSTTCQLLHTYHMFCEAVDNGKKFELFSAILVKPLTGSGINDYFINCEA